MCHLSVELSDDQISGLSRNEMSTPISMTMDGMHHSCLGGLHVSAQVRFAILLCNPETVKPSSVNGSSTAKTSNNHTAIYFQEVSKQTSARTADRIAPRSSSHLSDIKLLEMGNALAVARQWVFFFYGRVPSIRSAQDWHYVTFAGTVR